MRPVKGDRHWHKKLLPYPEVASWYNNLARRNQSTADERIRHIGRVLEEALGKTPVDLLGMTQSELEDAITQCIDHLFKRGLLGSTVTGFEKVVQSFLKWHGREIKRANAIPGAYEHPNADGQVMPSQEKLHLTLQAAELRTRAIICVIAQGGQRPNVLGRIDASDGLRLRDLVEMRILSDDVVFDRIPTRVKVSRNLNKSGRSYFFFIGPEACEYIRPYLRSRIRLGETLTPESPLFRPIGGEPRFIARNNIGDAVRRAMRQARVEGVPYIWRSYYANRCQRAESLGFLPAWRRFFMGHADDIQALYATGKETLPDDSVEAMRFAYQKALQFLESQASERGDRTQESTARVLTASGVSEDYVLATRLGRYTGHDILAVMREAIRKMAPGTRIDLRACKEGAARLYPPEHPLRKMLETEPNFLELDEAPVKMEMYLRLTLASNG